MDKEEMIHVYNKIWHNHKNKNAICSYMGGPRDYYNKQSKSEKDKYHTISLYVKF